MRKFLLNLLIIFAVTIKYSPYAQAVDGAASTSPASGASSDLPMGQSAEGNVNLLPEDVSQVNEEELFGLEGGYFHPYITVDLEYTDNLYNVDEGDQANLLTRVSPGIWFALPRKKIIPITINPHNTSPGGLQLQFEDYEGTDRFQAYALGGVDFNTFSDDSSLNSTTGVVEGMARYNARGGLALQAVDRFTHDEDILDIGSETRDQNRSYNSNFLMATADWDITDKFRIQGDYVNFMLGYDDEINQFMDRVDNGVNLYGYYNYSLITSFFVEYRFIDVSYDETTTFDNQSQFWYAGLKWDTTEKFSVLAKIGYQNKAFDDSSLGQEDFDGIVADLQFKYRYSEKTLAKLDFYRTNEETDNYLAADKTVMGVNFNYSQKFTDRWVGVFDVTFENAEYRNLNVYTLDDRTDDRFKIRPSIQYTMRDWLMFELAYRYERRDSTDDYFDYDSNTVMLSANLAI